jgi:hypothetical protein
VTLYPGVTDPDAEVPDDYEAVIVHSRSVTNSLVSENLSTFIEMVQLATEEQS